MNSLWDTQPDLKQQLLDWQNQAAGDVQVHVQRLSEDSVVARTEAAKALAVLGTASRGAILALIDCWTWTPPPPERRDRLEMTRRADAIRRMRRAVDQALAAIGAPVVEPLVALAQSDDRPVDKVNILAEVRDPAAVGPLVVALEADLPEIRKAAARALGAIGDVTAVEALGRALGDPDELVRHQAAIALREIGGGVAIQCLIVGLRSDDASIREAASELANVTDPDVADLLLAALSDDHEQVIVHAARALGAQKELGARLRLASLVTARSEAVQTAAMEALDKIEPDWWQSRLGHSMVPTLLENLRDQDPRLRARAAGLLGRIGHNRVVAPVIEALEDQDSATRGAAAEALGRIGDTQAVEPLIRALEREADASARRRMISTLGRLGDGPATDVLIAQLWDKSALDSVGAAVGALAQIGDPRAVEPLVTVLNEEGYGFRAAKAAAEALGAIGDPSAIDGLRAAIAGHWTDNTRVAGFVGRAAAEAIRQIETGSLQRPGGNA